MVKTCPQRAGSGWRIHHTHLRMSVFRYTYTYILKYIPERRSIVIYTVRSKILHYIGTTRFNINTIHIINVGGTFILY